MSVEVRLGREVVTATETETGNRTHDKTLLRQGRRRKQYAVALLDRLGLGKGKQQSSLDGGKATTAVCSREKGGLAWAGLTDWLFR